jgi:DNA-binding XRE family transcriptional regulator
LSTDNQCSTKVSRRQASDQGLSFDLVIDLWYIYEWYSTSHREEEPMTERGISLPLLRKRRQQAGLSQEELAERAGVGVATIIRIEGGAHARYETLGKLARALKLERKQLLQEDPQKECVA